MELCAAMDRTLNSKYIAVVIGSRDSINRNAELLKNFTHMSALQKGAKKSILGQLQTEGNILCYCIKFDIPKLLQLADERLANLNVLKHVRITDNIGSEMKISLQRLFGDFITKNGLTIEALTFEVDDSDVIEFLRKAGLAHEKPDLAHKIADCIVHANGKDWFVNSHVKNSPVGFANEFHMRVLNRIYR